MPTLKELYKYSFNKDMKIYHKAKYDVWNLYKIFFTIKDKIPQYIEVIM